MAIKIIKTYSSSGYDFGEEIPRCSYCNNSAEDTDLWETNICSDFICGEIECWNEYMFSNVLNNQIECEEKRIEICNSCEEEKEYCYCEDGEQ